MSKKTFLLWGVLALLFVFSKKIFPADLVLGDWTTVSTHDQVTFDGTGNEIVGFKQMNHGFEFTDENTRCTFNSVFPVSGGIDLVGGRLFLRQDLILANSVSTLVNSSQTNTAGIYGNDHIVEMAEQIGEFTGSFTFNNTHIFLNSDLVVDQPIFFDGDCSINGRGNRVIIQNEGLVSICPTTTVRFAVGGIRFDKTDVFSFDSEVTSKLQFKDFDIELHSDVIVDSGSIEFFGDILMRGPFTFTYDSGSTSTIKEGATLKLADDVTLQIGKRFLTDDIQPLEFESDTSRLVLDNANLHVTSSGMRFTKGGIKVYGKSLFTVDSTDTNYGLQFGDGTSGNDTLIKIKEGSELVINSGSVVMDEYDRTKFLFDGESGELSLVNSSTFYCKRSIAFDGGNLNFSDDSTIAQAADAYITTEKTRIYDFYQDINLTGTIVNKDSLLLDQNDELILNSGNLSKTITVSRGGNIFNGDGTISSNVLLVDENSTLTWSVDAKIDEYSMVLNDGTVVLERDLNFYQNLDTFEVGGDVTLYGTISLDNHIMQISARDSVWTGSFYLDGNGASLAFNAKVSLSGTWTVNGNVTIDGNGQTVDLGDFGHIYVAPNSQLMLRNIVVKNISDEQISCIDDTGEIVLDNVLLVQDGDYKFNYGSIIFRRDVDVVGGDTVYSFSYNSSKTSLIDKGSKLRLNQGIRFEIGNDNYLDSVQPLEFTDLTSILHIDNSELRVVDQGLKLKSGRVLISNNSTFCIDTTYGVTLGDGSDSGSDFVIEIEGDAKLIIEDGILYYNNVDSSDKIRFINDRAILRINGPGGLTAQSDILLENGTLSFPFANYLSTLGSSVIDYDKVTHIHDVPYSSHLISGRFQTGLGYLLADSDFIAIEAGEIAEPVIFDPGTSKICGVGVISADLTLRDKDSSAFIAIEPEINSNIVLNGGNLTLSTHLNFVSDKKLTGSGTVDLNNNRFSFGTNDLNFTGTVLFENGGSINLGAKTSLSGTWTFDGVVGLHGDGNILDLGTTGKIVINYDSTLNLRDVVIKGLGDNLGNFVFMNDNSQIYMNNLAVVLEDNYTMTIGGIYIDGLTVWHLDNNDWIFSDLSSVTVDGTVLWKDSLDETTIGNINFGSPKANYLSLMNSGTIKETANYSIIGNEINNLDDEVTVVEGDLSELYSYFETINHGPTNITYNTNTTLPYNIYLGPDHTMSFQDDLVFNGSTRYIHFSRSTDEPILFVDAGKTVTLQDVVLKDFDPERVSLGSGASIVFGQGVTIELIDDITLSRQWTFTGDTKIKGFDNKIILDDGGMLDVYNNSRLTFEDVVISGVGLSDDNLRIRTQDGSIVLKDSQLNMSHDYTFSYGSMLFDGDVKITGTKTFVYASSMGSTISSESQLLLDVGVCFSYDPPTGNRDLLILTDTSSRLYLNGICLYSTPTGLRLTNGIVLFENIVTLSAEGQVVSEAIAFENIVSVLGGAYVEIYGYVDLA